MDIFWQAVDEKNIEMGESIGGYQEIAVDEPQECEGAGQSSS